MSWKVSVDVPPLEAMLGFDRLSERFGLVRAASPKVIWDAWLLAVLMLK